MLDATAMLLDSHPTAVSGTLDPVVHPDCRGPQFRDPGGWGIVLFENGVKVYVDATQTAKAPPELQIIGQLGRIAVRRDDADLRTWQGECRAIATPSDRPTTADLAVDEILHCLTHAVRPSSTGEAARHALEFIIGFHVSHREQGKWVSLPLAGEDRDLEVLVG